jgi:type I restriction enzyme S subunit
VTHSLKPYPAYEDSGVPCLGTIPIHWEVRRNGRLFSERKQTGYPDLPILEVSLKTGVRVRDLEDVKRKQVIEDRATYKRAVKGDIAYNMMRMWQGAVGVVPFDGLVSPAYVVARPYPEVDSRYYAYLFRTDAYMSEVNKYSHGIVTDRNRLYWDEFKQMPSALPPIEEQIAIADYLDANARLTRGYIRAKRRLIELLNEQKRAIIQRAVTRGLDPSARLKPSGIDWLGDIPAHWDVWQIGHLADVGNGSTPSRGNRAYWAERGYPWLNSSSVNQSLISSANQFVTDIALRECHLPKVKPGSVLVAITGQGKTRGTAAVLAIEATINQHIAYIMPRQEVVSSEYLRFSLVGAYSQLRAISDDSGSTKGALTCQDLEGFRVALPPSEEQGRIVKVVQDNTRETESAIAWTYRKIDLIREYRTRLIADVVTGKVDVRELAAGLPEVEEAEPQDDVPAEVEAATDEDPELAEEDAGADD